jgi:hypothetical protein
MSQKFNGIQPKFTFGEFGIQVVVSQSLKNNMEMFRMIFRIFGMRYMKYAGALVRPNDMTRYS